MKRYTHLSLEERTLISHYHDNGSSIRQISHRLGRSASSISRELRRNRNRSGYKASTAEKRYLVRREKKSRLDLDPILQVYVIDRLHEGFSPEFISIRLKHFGHLEGVGYINPESIYQWLYLATQKKKKLHKLLRRAHGTRGRKKRATRGIIQNKTSIHERPDSVQERTEIGHWEVDLMAFLRNSQHMLVIHERATRYTGAIKLKNKTAAETLKSLLDFFQALPKELVKSITFDNGTEFARHQDLAQFLQVETFFCDTYASWQKGGIENMNGRFRRDLPRSTNLKALPDAELEQIVLNHNMTPRKCLNALSPIEALAKHMGKDIIFSFNKGVALHP